MKRKYTRKQILESIKYWKKQLKNGNYKRLNESNETLPGLTITVQDIDNWLTITNYKSNAIILGVVNYTDPGAIRNCDCIGARFADDGIYFSIFDRDMIGNDEITDFINTYDTKINDFTFYVNKSGDSLTIDQFNNLFNKYKVWCAKHNYDLSGMKVDIECYVAGGIKGVLNKVQNKDYGIRLMCDFTDVDLH